MKTDQAPTAVTRKAKRKAPTPEHLEAHRLLDEYLDRATKDQARFLIEWIRECSDLHLKGLTPVVIPEPAPGSKVSWEERLNAVLRDIRESSVQRQIQAKLDERGCENPFCGLFVVKGRTK